MESLFIVLLDGRASMFESVDNRFDAVRIKGEERIQLKTDQVDWCIRELLSNLGVDDLQEWSVSVIYDPVTSDLLSPVLARLLPHKPSGLEVRSLESLMPELLLKCRMISPGQKASVALGTQCWQVSLTEDGRVSEISCLEGVTPDERLSECDIPGALRTDYSFTTNRKELEQCEAQLEIMTNNFDTCNRCLKNIQKELEQTKLTQLLLQKDHSLKQNFINELSNALSEVCQFAVSPNMYTFKNFEKLSKSVNPESFGGVFGAAMIAGNIIFNKNENREEIDNQIANFIARTKNTLVINNIYSILYSQYGEKLNPVIFDKLLSNPKCPKNILESIAQFKNKTIAIKAKKILGKL